MARPQRFRVVFKGLRLPDDKTLADCQVPDEASLFLVLADKPKVRRASLPECPQRSQPTHSKLA